MNRPASTLGLRHVALYVQDMAASEHFYVDLLGMQVEWRPDPDNLYLSTSGQDNLALHRRSDGAPVRVSQIAEVTGVHPETTDVLIADIFNRRNGHSLEPTGRLPSFIDTLVEKHLLDLEFLYGRWEAQSG
mgnify:CR=1 FL=1